MSSSAIVDRHRKIEITEVRRVTVTEIVTADGQSSRAIRIFGEPVANNLPVEVIEIVIASADAAHLKITAPEQPF